MFRGTIKVAGLVLMMMSVAWGQATLSNFTATPGTITFTLNNPGSAMPGSASAVVSIKATKAPAFTHPNWSMTVSGASTTMTGAGCPSIPVSAVTVSCSAPTFGGRSGTATCSGNFTLSASPQTFVSGQQGDTGNPSYGATLTFTLNDSWQYFATTGQACSLTLNYSATFF